MPRRAGLRLCAGALVLLHYACTEGGQSSDDGAPRQDAGGDGGKPGSGTPGGGDGPLCNAMREETTEDEPILEYSISELLGAATGEFDIPIRWGWGRRCGENANDAGTDECVELASVITELVGTDTFVHLAIRYGGEAAIVLHPTKEQPICAAEMRVPVVVTLSSDDGALDEELNAEIASGCGNDASVNFSLPLSELAGRLGGVAAHLPDELRFDFFSWFIEDRVGVGIYVGNDSFTVLSSDLPPFDEHTQDLPRRDVEREPGVPLRGGHECVPF